MLRANYLKWVFTGYYIILSLLLASCFSNSAKLGGEDIKISSPKGKLILSFHLDNGIPFYSLKQGNTTLINNSRLGLRFNGDYNFDKNFKLLSVQVSESTSGSKKTSNKVADNLYKVLKVVLQDKVKSDKQLVLIFNVEDKKLSFRYQVPLQSKGHRLVLIDELTEFSLTNNYDIYNSLEKPIESNKIGGLTEPAKMPLRLSYGDSLNICITEDSNPEYSPIALINNGNNTLKINVDANISKASLNPGNILSFTSPWRIISITN